MKAKQYIELYSRQAVAREDVDGCERLVLEPHENGYLATLYITTGSDPEDADSLVSSAQYSLWLNEKGELEIKKV